MLVCVSTYFLKCGSIFEKVLLKLSSTFKLRNFDAGTKMIAIAPHLLIYTYLRRSEYYQIGVGYCFIRAKVMRRPECRINMIQSSHLFYRELDHLGD